MTGFGVRACWQAEAPTGGRFETRACRPWIILTSNRRDRWAQTSDQGIAVWTHRFWRQVWRACRGRVIKDHVTGTQAARHAFSAGQTYPANVRAAYHEELTALTEQLGQMCGLAGVAMERATQALLQADLLLAEQVITDHDQITAMSAQAAERAFVLLALQAPVAGDLRAIIGAIQIAANIDRMGALALHVAKIARRRHPQHALPEQVNGYFAEMGRVAVELGNSTREVLLTHDPDKAARIDEQDDAMDDLHRRLFSVLMDHEWKHGVAAAVAGPRPAIRGSRCGHTASGGRLACVSCASHKETT